MKTNDLKAWMIPDMGFASYLADHATTPEPSLTSSTVRDLLDAAPVKTFLGNPRLNPYYEKPSGNAKFDLGTAAHALFVGGGERIHRIGARKDNGDPVDAYRSNEAKAERDRAWKEGATPVLAHQYPEIEAMTEAAYRQFEQSPDIRPVLADPDLMREASVFWREGDIYCRCRPDLYLLSKGLPVVVHYKTTAINVTPWTVERYASDMGWHLTAAHYEAGIEALTGRRPAQYFAIQENRRPYLTLTVRLSEAFVELGRMRRGRAVEIWSTCMSTGEWPGNISTTVEIECPAWAEALQIERRDAEEAEKRATGGDVANLYAMFAVGGAATAAS